MGLGVAAAPYVLANGIPHARVASFRMTGTTSEKLTAFTLAAVTGIVLGTLGEHVGQTLEKNDSIWILP